MIDLSQHFDDFNLRARVYPALLMCAPVLANIVLIWPSAPLVRLVPLAMAIGVLFFLADTIRGSGQELEKKLIAEWGGLPAQRALWLDNNENLVLTKKIRGTVEQLIGRSLPTKQQEKRNPTRASQEYDAVIRDLIPRVRGQDKDALLHGENIRYSFRRNTLAIKSLAVSLAIACTIGDILMAAIGYQRTEALTALGVSLVALVTWLLVVRKKWVLQAAVTYSRRFYDAIGSLPMDGQQQ